MIEPRRNAQIHAALFPRKTETEMNRRRDQFQSPISCVGKPSIGLEICSGNLLFFFNGIFSCCAIEKTSAGYNDDVTIYSHNGLMGIHELLNCRSVHRPII